MERMKTMKKKILCYLKSKFEFEIRILDYLRAKLYIFLLKLDKGPYITSLIRFFIIILGIFTLFLFIVLIIILAPIIY
jgi:hypothetical protein